MEEVLKMSDFTYEKEDRENSLEKYEWDNVWIDTATDLSRKRVLYIGDSISCGSRRKATLTTNESILFDGFGTSKAVDNPYFKDSVKLFAKQEVRRDAVIFNNGLHGFHLDDSTEYKKHYEEMVKFLLEEFAGTPLIIVLTTHVADENRNNRVLLRNKAATEIAEKYGLKIIDLYSVSLENEDLLRPDGVHFTDEGYQKLVDEILNGLKGVI